MLISIGLSLTTAVLFSQQKIYQLKADSVRIFSNCDTAELILENRTRSQVNGVLTNKGSGVTEFRKVMVKQGDSMFIIGGDTLYAAAISRNIYNSNGRLTTDRLVDGNSHHVQFTNNNSFLIANNGRPVIVSRSPMDSIVLGLINNSTTNPYTGLAVRGTGCDAKMVLLSDSAGTCNEEQMIDFATLKPRKDSWLTALPPAYGDKNLLARILLQTSGKIADYATLSFSVKSDTTFFHDGAFSTISNAGFSGGYNPMPVMQINPSFKHPTQNFNTKMPYVQVNGGLFVGYARNWFFNSKNAKDIIYGVDDVPGFVQPFYETRFSVYADSLPLKIYKLPAIRGSAFLTYTPTQTVEGNNVAFEYKDSVYEEIRKYISLNGLTIPSDSGLKENVDVSATDAGKLLSLSIKDFSYKADKNRKRYTGLIAQELKMVFPELVTGAEGSYGIDYIKMIPYLLKIMQSQQKEIERMRQQPVMDGSSDIKATLQQLQQKLQSQDEEINMLKQIFKQ